MFPANDKMQKALDKREAEGCLRKLSLSGNRIDFCSNDYLGFANSNELKLRIKKNSERFEEAHFSIGSTGSRLISGNSRFLESLEEFIANFHRAESGLIFNSGYDANIGLFASVPQRGDTILYDELIHASIRDGIRLSFADSFSFRHNDLNDLNNLLAKVKGNVFVAVESIYSMDGDFAPLKELAELCSRRNAQLIVDEAHATGVIGENGEGFVAHLNLQHKVFARIHTFGKSLGCHGAIILGSNLLRNYLINFARSFIYTTALSTHIFIAVKCAYDMLSDSQSLRENLNENIQFFKEHISSIDELQLLPSSSQIQGIIFNGNNNVSAVAKHMQHHGFDIKAIMSPTVPKDKERLRICLHAFNTEQEIIGMIKELQNGIAKNQ